MPKGTEYKITWAVTQGAYVLEHAPFSFPLTDDALASWLKLIEAFHFQAASGHSFTARKETKQRGTAYWYAYKRVGGKLRKKYLGDDSKVTLQTLEALVSTFAEAPQTETTAQHAPPPPPRKPTLRFEKTLPSALALFGFSAIPTKVALVNKYRELVKVHHPDKGGIHQDMVAVNLAYDLLKRYVH